jgi:cobalt/nickel transport system permease protein
VIDEPLARGDSLIHDLDPRAKLVACVAFSLTAALAVTPGAPLGVLAAGLVLTALSRPPLGLLFKRLCAVNVFVAFLWLVLPLTAPGEPWRRLWWGLVVTRQGLALAGLITLKTNAIFLCVLSLVSSTPAPALAQAMTALRVPEKFAFLFLFSYRYLHVIAEEYGRLAMAARLRGFVPATNWHTYRSQAALVAMVLVKSFDRSQRVYQAMVLRGFTGTFPSLGGLSAGRRDLVFGVFVGLALGLALGLELWWRGHVC